MIYVIDASVVLKWFLPEPDNAAADLLLEMLLNDEVELIAPDLLLVETANALWKRTARKELSGEEVLRIHRDLLTLPISFAADADLANDALQVAVTHNHPVYDSLYCALAAQRQCEFVTADPSLVNKFKDVFRFVRYLPSIRK